MHQKRRGIHCWSQFGDFDKKCFLLELAFWCFLLVCCFLFWTLIWTEFLQIYSISIEFSIPGVFAFLNVQNCACFLIVDLDSLLFLQGLQGEVEKSRSEQNLKSPNCAWIGKVEKEDQCQSASKIELIIYLDFGFIEDLMRLNFLFGIVLFKIRRIARVHNVRNNRRNQPLLQNIVPVYRWKLEWAMSKETNIKSIYPLMILNISRSFAHIPESVCSISL